MTALQPIPPPVQDACFGVLRAAAPRPNGKSWSQAEAPPLTSDSRNCGMWYERVEVNKETPPPVLHTGTTHADTPSRKRRHREDLEDEDEPRHFCRVRLISWKADSGILRTLSRQEMESSQQSFDRNIWPMRLVRRINACLRCKAMKRRCFHIPNAIDDYPSLSTESESSV